MKDRYNFDAHTSFDEFYLGSTDEKITARREARKARLAKRADVAVITPEEILETKRKKKYKIEVSKLAVAILVVAAVLAFVVIAGVKLTNLQVEKRAAEKKLESLNQRAAQLQDELSELDSDEYIENAARSELHMIRDGEVMYIVNPDLGEPEPDENAPK